MKITKSITLNSHNKFWNDTDKKLINKIEYLFFAGNVIEIHGPGGHGRRAVHRRLEAGRGRHGGHLSAAFRPDLHARSVRFGAVRTHFPSLLFPEIRPRRGRPATEPVRFFVVSVIDHHRVLKITMVQSVRRVFVL